MAYGFIYVALSLIPVLAYVAGGVFAVIQWNRFPKPSRLLLVAVSLMVATSVLSIGVPFVIARAFSPQNTANFMLALSAASTFLHLLSFSLLVMAVYSGRGVANDFTQRTIALNPDADMDHGNPYIPPR